MTSRVKEFDEELDENFERKGVEGWVTNNRKRGGAAQALRLREEFGVYMLDSSRINVAAVNASNVDYLAQAVAKVL